MKKVVDMLVEIKEDMKQFTFHLRMETCDMSDFFPLKDHDTLNRFLDKSHEDWTMRRKGFYHLLFTTVTRNKKKFGTALLRILFSREFIANHKWPYPGYDDLSINISLFPTDPLTIMMLPKKKY